MLSKHYSLSFGSLFRRLAATLSPPFPRIPLLKFPLLSTSTAGNGTPTGHPEADNTCPISAFLLNECGLRQSELSTILKARPSLVRRTSIHTPQQAVQFMKYSGFTEHQVRKIITRYPTVLLLSADRQLKPKIELFKTLGVTAQDLPKVIFRAPRLFGSNLEKTVCANIQYLQNLFGSEADIYRVLKCAPNILLTSNGPEIFEQRLKHLASFGLLENDVKELFRRSPTTLTVSMDKVQEAMDFFIQTAGLPAKFLLSYPKAVAPSLERTIKPRYKVLKSISVMQPSKRLPSLAYVVSSLGERKFLEKYVECSPHSTKLLEIYRGTDNVF